MEEALRKVTRINGDIAEHLDHDIAVVKLDRHHFAIECLRCQTLIAEETFFEEVNHDEFFHET